MHVLFDQGTPVPLRKYVSNHQVSTAYELGWASLKNGELLQRAEQSGFDVFVTTDRNLRYQQNLAGRKIAVVVLAAASWPRVEKATGAVVEAITVAASGSFVEVLIP